MEDLKVRVFNEKESKEVQELFFELGYRKGDNYENQYPCFVVTSRNWTTGAHIKYIRGKEITTQELKDMVVLKRNDVNDKTHLYYGAAILKQGDKNYAFSSGKGWFLSNVNDENLKEISKIKEYLEPHPNGKYVFVESQEQLHPSWIEIPEGCEDFRGNNVFYKNNGKMFFNGRFWEGSCYSDFDILWQRKAKDEDFLNIPSFDIDVSDISFSNPKLQDEDVKAWENRPVGRCRTVPLDFDEPKEKHSHYKKDISHLNVLDPYRISELYGLHSCADHIMKKSLCAGGRGHKDLLTDIKNIIDTAERWKQMVLEDANSSED